jgi:hypothetical protein
LRQAAVFVERIASGALTSEFSAERRRLEGRIERLRMQHTKVVRDKLAVENRSCNLLEKLTAAEADKEDLSRRLAEEREGAEKARAEAKAVRAEASLALKHATDVESGLKSLGSYAEKTEASTHAGLTERTRCSWTRTASSACETPLLINPVKRSASSSSSGFRRSWSRSCSMRPVSCPTPRSLPVRGL